ncbi:MAG TPA: hypothetical protein VF062_13220 [Candidatus Limnocylindrales bacterium]
MTEYQYFVYGSWEKPEELWRAAAGDQWEYLSLREWRWMARDERVFPRHPEALEAITPEQAAELEADRQRLVRYWVNRAVDPPMIYRRRRLPAIEEVFGRSNHWSDTSTISDYLYPSPRQAPKLDEIDAETAERILQDTRGISGATRL